MAANISPQLARKLREKASRLLCQQCWVPLILIEKKGQPKPHPCLFCEACLKKCGSSPKISEKSWRECNFKTTSGPQSGNVWKKADKEAIMNPKEQGNMRNLTTTMRSEQSMDSLEDDGENTVINNSAFGSKLRQFDKTATRCGFCPRGEKRKTLVCYCFHCRKHLCRCCNKKHNTERLYRYHATVDLGSTAKQGLQ